MSSIVAICLAGCEKEVSDDISGHVRLFDGNTNLTIKAAPIPKITNSATKLNNNVIFRGESGCGKVVLENVDNFCFIENVRSVQFFMLHVGGTIAMTLQKAELTDNLHKIFVDVDFEKLLNVWKSCLSRAVSGINQAMLSNTRKPKFCVRCIRDGDHEYSSMDVSMQLGGIIIDKTGWEVDLCQMDFEVVVLQLNECLLAGIHIPTKHSLPFLKSKLPREVRHPSLPSKIAPSLRPSTAYTLGLLAAPQPHEVLIDCMCGSGSGFVEAAYSHNCIGIGGDVDCDLHSTLLETLGLLKDMTANRAVAQVSSSPYCFKHSF